MPPPPQPPSPYEAADKVQKYVNEHIVRSPGERWFQHYENYAQIALQSCSHIIAQHLSTSLSNLQHSPDHSKQILYFIDYLLYKQPKYRSILAHLLFAAMISQYEHLLQQKVVKCGPLDTGEVTEIENVLNKFEIIVNLWAERQVFPINDTMTLQQQLQILSTQYQQQYDQKLQSIAFLSQPNNTNEDSVNETTDISTDNQNDTPNSIYPQSDSNDYQQYHSQPHHQDHQEDEEKQLDSKRLRQDFTAQSTQPYSNHDDEVFLSSAQEHYADLSAKVSNKVSAQQTSLFRGGFGDLFFHQREALQASSRDQPNQPNKRIMMEYHRHLIAGQDAAPTIHNTNDIANFSQLALLSFRPASFDMVSCNRFLCRSCGLYCKDEQVHRTHLSLHSAVIRHRNRQVDQLLTITQAAHPYSLIVPLKLSHYDDSFAIITSMDESDGTIPKRSFEEDNTNQFIPTNRQHLFQNDVRSNYTAKSRAWYVDQQTWPGFRSNLSTVPRSLLSNPDHHNFHPMIDCTDNDQYRTETKMHDDRIKEELAEQQKAIKAEMDQPSYVGPVLPKFELSEQFQTAFSDDTMINPVKVELNTDQGAVGTSAIKEEAPTSDTGGEQPIIDELQPRHDDQSGEDFSQEPMKEESEQEEEWDDDDYVIDFKAPTK